MKIAKILILPVILMLALFSASDVAYSGTNAQIVPLRNGQTSEQKFLTLYMTYVEYCLLLNLRKAKIYERHKFGMEFRVEKDGRISGYNIIQLSDSIEYDRKVQQTVLNTGPFQPFPKELNKDSISFQLHIDGADISLVSLGGSPKMNYKIKQNGPSRTVQISEAKSVSTTSSESNGNPIVLTMSVAQQVQANWFPPLTYNNIVVVSFKLDESRKVEDIKVISGTTDEKAISAALYAIRSIQQIRLNSTLSSKSKTVKYRFSVVDATEN